MFKYDYKELIQTEGTFKMFAPVVCKRLSILDFPPWTFSSLTALLCHLFPESLSILNFVLPS